MGIRFTIASGATVSDAIDISGFQLVALEIPSNFDGTTITFQAAEVSSVGQTGRAWGTYYAVYAADGTQYTITTAASRRVQISPADLLGVKSLKLVAGTAQATDDTIITAVVAHVA